MFADDILFLQVRIGRATFPATADANGDWEIEANHPSGDTTVTSSTGEVLSAKNVVGGDVYFCSGEWCPAVYLVVVVAAVK